MNKIETEVVKNLKDYITKTNEIAKTNFILENEDIFIGQVILYDKLSNISISFSFPRDAYNFLKGIRYGSNMT